MALLLAAGGGAQAQTPPRLVSGGPNQGQSTIATTPHANDFDTRKTSPGVVRWFDFDSTAQLGGGYGANVGVLPGTSTRPVIDNSVKASGAGSLRFDVPSLSGPNAAGAWWANFSPDLLTQFGENSQFFIQWRQRFNQAFIDTYVLDASGGAPQGGIKQVDVVTGDRPGRIYNSCEALETVIQTYYQYRFPIVYNSCTGSGSHSAYAGLYETTPSFDYLLQNARPVPGCTYTQTHATGIASTVNAPPGCFAWEADEWMTFQIGITLGPRDNVNKDFLDSRVQFWAAREGRSSQLLLDWKPGVRGYFPLAAGPPSDNQKFGKVWLLPYMTNKNPKQSHGLMQTWYDEVIISTQRIPDPTLSSTAMPSTPSASPHLPGP